MARQCRRGASCKEGGISRAFHLKRLSSDLCRTSSGRRSATAPSGSCPSRCGKKKASGAAREVLFDACFGTPRRACRATCGSPSWELRAASMEDSERAVVLDARALDRRVAVVLQVPLEPLDVGDRDLHDLPRPVLEAAEGVVRHHLHAFLRSPVADEIHKRVPDVPLGALVDRQVDEVVLTLEAEAVQLLHEHAPRVHVWDVPDHQCQDLVALDLVAKLLDKVGGLRHALVAKLPVFPPDVLSNSVPAISAELPDESCEVVSKLPSSALSYAKVSAAAVKTHAAVVEAPAGRLEAAAAVVETAAAVVEAADEAVLEGVGGGAGALILDILQHVFEHADFRPHLKRPQVTGWHLLRPVDVLPGAKVPRRADVQK
eukprot:CAMPEP_0179378832 /NCGR_PEP_ID=MMETSP0797-20121207/89533_1 /TAXON_ID=47934 /ORGANISM="Dinophysis acuminata, Strain DAEP01" /LENGTH=373 /DNA_ID=CAMNT_0021094905 /DNA_START=123 /DNA_END=1245 /DNA_ORIENTATION=+